MRFTVTLNLVTLTVWVVAACGDAEPQAGPADSAVADAADSTGLDDATDLGDSVSTDSAGDAESDGPGDTAPDGAATNLAELTWEPVGGPPGGGVFSFVQDPERPGRLYAGSHRGLYVSDDRGVSWHLYERHAFPRAVGPVAVSADLLFASSGELFRLDADNPSWDAAEPVFERCTGATAADGRLYATRDSEATGGHGLELYWADPETASPDSWTDITPAGETLSSLLGAELLASKFSGINDLLVSDGRLLIVATVADGPVPMVAAGASGPSRIWARALLASADGGTTWADSTPPLPSHLVIQKVARDPDDDRHLVVSARSRGDQETWSPLTDLLWESFDGGRSWQRATPIDHVIAPTVGDVDIRGDRLWLTDLDGGLAELDASREGIERRPMPEVPGLSEHFPIAELVVDLHDDDVVYGLNGGQGTIRSDDGGMSWAGAMGGMVLSTAANVSVHPTDPNTFATSNNRDFPPFITHDGGASWSVLLGLSTFADELTFDPHDPDHVLFVNELTGFNESTDRGDSWQNVATAFDGQRVADVVVSGNVVYASLLGTGISRFGALDRFDELEAAGELPHFWEHLYGSPDYAYDLAGHPSDPDILYATYSPKLFEDFASLWRYQREGDAGEWTELLRVEGAAGMTSVAVDPSRPERLYAGVTGEEGLVYASADAGESWQVLNDDGFTFVTIHELALAPSDQDRLYAAPWGGGLYASHDAGDSWAEVPAPTVSIAAIAIDPDDADHLWIGDRTRPAVFETDDGGASWSTAMSLDAGFYRVIALGLHQGDLYVSVMRRPGGINAPIGGPPSGASFRLGGGEPTLLGGDMDRTALSFTSTGDALYAVGHIGGIFELDGDSWENISGDLPDIGFNHLIVARDGSLLAAGASDLDVTLSHRGGDPEAIRQLYRSTDGGTHWSPMLVGDPLESGIKRIWEHPTDDGVFFAGTGAGVFVSTDDGATWNAANDGLDVRATGAMAVGSTRVHLGTLGGGVYSGSIRTEADYDIDWATSAGPHPTIHNLQVTVDPADGDVLYVSAFPGGVFKTADGGESWSEQNFAMPSFAVTDPLTQGYYSLTVDPSAPETLYLGVYQHGIFKSTNGAGTWYPMYGAFGQNLAVMQSPVTRLAVDPTDSATIYLATHEGVYRSRDGAASWEPLNDGLNSLDVLSLVVADDGTAFAGTGGYGVYFYDEGEGAWRHMQRVTGFGEWAPWERRLYQYSALLFDAELADRVYLGHFPGGFFVSDDGGHSWQASSLGLGNDGMFSLAQHPDEPDILYAGTYNGVVRSDDRGYSWRMTSQGLPSEQWPFTVSIDPTDPDVMYVATKNGQNRGFCERNEFCGWVAKSEDGGESWTTIMDGLDDQQEYYSLVIHPDDTALLFLSASQGVYASEDGGEHWVPIRTGLPDEFLPMRDNVAQNLQLTADRQSLLLGLTGYGVWRADVSGLEAL